MEKAEKSNLTQTGSESGQKFLSKALFSLQDTDGRLLWSLPVDSSRVHWAIYVKSSLNAAVDEYLQKAGAKKGGPVDFSEFKKIIEDIFGALASEDDVSTVFRSLSGSSPLRGSDISFEDFSFGGKWRGQSRGSLGEDSLIITDNFMAGHVEMTVALENLAIHKAKRAKKQVSYHVSVPMDKSPLGNDGYREIPSDTDTTSCFDSDGTYIRSEAQSSDSGAALLSHSKRRGRKGGRASGGRGGAGMSRGLKKARSIIRSHEDFFRAHDNKYWLVARQVILASDWSSDSNLPSHWSGLFLDLNPLHRRVYRHRWCPHWSDASVL